MFFTNHHYHLFGASYILPGAGRFPSTRRRCFKELFEREDTCEVQGHGRDARHQNQPTGLRGISV